MRAAGGRVGTASVYRALGALQEAELVRALDLGEGERRYELVHADGEHHHHVVCDDCGDTTPFHDDALERSIAERRAAARLAGRRARRRAARPLRALREARLSRRGAQPSARTTVPWSSQWPSCWWCR